ncbi:MAG: glycosyltransferase [Candidatus Saccharimonadales bacterium]
MLIGIRYVGGRIFAWLRQVTTSSIILAILIFIVVNFYIFSSIVSLNDFFYAFLLLSVLTDGAFVLLHLPRRRRHIEKVHFSPSKVTVIIACRNGEAVIEETIKSAARQVPLKQIIVVSDASNDRTAEIARACGVQVLENETNLHKVGSINVALAHVHTPYVLILDDDTLIGDSFIPTSLLDDGYTAVAFNVMPVKEKTVINELQQFEYRHTMQLAKHLRATAGAIGNVSGAIGLYRTDDLRKQITLHSGQFAGEDEQRTLLAHMYGTGKGITYTDSLVLTKAPATYRDLFRQRAFSWSLAVPELFMLYWRVILSPRFHYLLKAEKAYYIYIYLTEPLRILFFWTLIMRPNHFAVTYAFYLAVNVAIWFKLGRKDSLRAVLLSPIYTLALTLSRFIGYFYWLKVKTEYLFRRLYRPATSRLLLVEYATTFVIIVSSWATSVQHYRNEMQLFDKIRTDNLTSNEQAFNYDVTTNAAALLLNDQDNPDRITVLVEQGDSSRALAHKAIDKLLLERPDLKIEETKRWRADMWLAQQLPASAIHQPNTPLHLPQDLVIRATEQTNG